MTRTASLLLWLLPCLVALASSSDADTLSRERRDIRMLRMGKRAFNLLRMGRSVPLEPRMAHTYNERQLDQIPRMGKDIDFYPFRESRSPPLPRLGDDEDERLDKLIEKIRREADVSGSVYGGERSARSVESVLGDGENEQEVRAVPLPRLGLRELLDKYGDEVDPLQHLGYRDADGDKQIDYEELLNENAVNDEERAVPLPRLGMRDEEERAVPLPRLGVRDIDEKKAMGMLRMGKRELDEEPQEKRAMGMLRMGKRAMGMLRMGKRAMGMLRMGKRELDENEMPAEDKRSMSMLRMGKRAMGMLRMGRSDGSSNAEEAEKRGMSMLRMGKKAMGMLRMGKRSMEEGQEMQDKRAMGMLRMGRSMGMLRMGRAMNDAEEEKRAMGMLRMGKRAMGMLRMGKRPVSMLRMGKKAMGMLRMGKRDLEDENVQLPAQDKQALAEDSEKTVQE